MSAALAYEVYVAWISDAFTDTDDAVPLALSYIQSVAEEKRWSAAWLRYAQQLVSAADTTAGVDGIGHARDFWGHLIGYWSDAVTKTKGGTPANWDKLGALWVRMRDMDLDASQAPDGLDYAWEWVAESAQDIRDIGGAIGNAADALSSGARGLENLTETGTGQGVLLLAAAAAALLAFR